MSSNDTSGTERFNGKELAITVGQWRLGIFAAHSVDKGNGK